MIKAIMKTGALTAALAAFTLLTPSAAAQQDRSTRSYSTYQYDNHDRRSERYSTHEYHYRPNTRYGHTYGHYPRHRDPSVSRQDHRQAIRQCGAFAQYRTDDAFPGPYGVSEYLGRPYVERLGPRGYRVYGTMQVSGRRQSQSVQTICTIRRDRVVRHNLDPHAIRQSFRDRRHGYGW